MTLDQVRQHVRRQAIKSDNGVGCRQGLIRKHVIGEGDIGDFIARPQCLLIRCFINYDDAGQAVKPSIGIEFGLCGDIGSLLQRKPIMRGKEFDQSGRGISETL